MANKSNKKRSKTTTNGGADRLKSFMRSPSGIWIGTILLIAILLSFNALVAGGSLEIFLGLNALEMIIAAIVIWLILLRRRTE